MTAAPTPVERTPVERLIGTLDAAARSAIGRRSSSTRRPAAELWLSESAAYAQPLIAALQALNDEPLREFALDALVHLIAAAYAFGSAEGLDLADLHHVQVTSAQLKNRANAASRRERLRVAIIAAADGAPLVASRKFAETLVGAVRKAIISAYEDMAQSTPNASIDPKFGTSAATIEREIGRILKERQDDTRHP